MDAPSSKFRLLVVGILALLLTSFVNIPIHWDPQAGDEIHADVTDFLTVQIYKKWSDTDELASYTFIEKTDIPTSIPITYNRYGSPPYSIKLSRVFGASENFGNDLTRNIFFRGNWVVLWWVSGTIDRDCNVTLWVDEFDIPGMMIGFAPILGIYETQVTEAGADEIVKVWTLPFKHLNGISCGDVYNPVMEKTGRICARIEWTRVPSSHIANTFKGGIPPEYITSPCDFKYFPGFYQPGNYSSTQ